MALSLPSMALDTRFQAGMTYYFSLANAIKIGNVYMGQASCFSSTKQAWELNNMAVVLKDTEYHTYGDYLHWLDDVRYELINGKAFVMRPTPNLAHQDAAGEIYYQVANALLGKSCRVFIGPVDVRLPKQQEADKSIDTVVQPDVLVVCDSNKLDIRGVRGAPDWVVEVLSPSTAGHDQIKKRQLYEQHGLREYWLVHAIDRVLTIYRLENNEYGKPDILPLEGETAVSILPEIVIHWDELASRLPKDY